MKKCPFCDGEAVAEEHGQGWRITCENRHTTCPMNMRTHHQASEKKAIEAWNTRIDDKFAGVEDWGFSGWWMRLV